jgi:hypothetical protein
MGTRSLTTVIEKGNWEGKNWKQKIVTMYRQMDGYPEGMGNDLAEFLEGGQMVNGISISETGAVFNGAGCLAAQMVAHFKDGAGGYYLHRGGATNCGENYRYEVIVEELKPIVMKCIEIGYMNKKGNYVDRARTVYEGSPEKFKAWLELIED